jgi:hypothetical protein
MNTVQQTSHGEAQDSDRLDLHAEPTGRGTTFTVTARRGGEVVACEQFNVAKGKERQRFIDTVRDRLGDDADRLLNADMVERQLAEAAACLAAPPAPPAPVEVVELGDGRVVRPERIILPAISGLAVPRRILRDGEPATDFMLYLQWQDGNREALSMPDVLPVGSEQVFIVPKPTDPPPLMPPGWSAASREAWLAGATSMPPDRMCRLLIEGFAKYLDLPAETAGGTVTMLTCFTVLTYSPSVFSAVPYLSVSGPMGSGKSRILELLQQVVFRPLLTSSTSEAAIFRSLDAFGNTALLDEAERLREPEMQGLLANLLAGYKRGGTASRCEATGDGRFLLRHFNVFGPKVFAAINELPATLASRSLAIPMFRSPKNSPKPKLRVDDDAERWQSIRDALHTLALERGSEWLDLPSRQDVVPEMSGRNYELWMPLLTIAAWLEDHGARGLLDSLRNHALLLIESSREAATPPDDEALLRALARAVGTGVPPTASELLATVQAGEPSLFRSWSARGVAAHLKRYGLKSKKRNGRHIFDTAPGDLLRVQEAYGIDLDLDPPDPTPTPPPAMYPDVPDVPRARVCRGT